MAEIKSANLLYFDNCTLSVGELVQQFTVALAETPIAVVATTPVAQVAAAALMASSNADGMVVPRERLTDSVRRALLLNGFALLDIDDGSYTSAEHNCPAIPGRVTLMTSGTTGAPKLIHHTWKSLFTMARARQLPPRNWLLTYQGGTYAWFQMVTLLFFGQEQALTVASQRTATALCDAASTFKADAISATPTFWRLAFLQVPQSQLHALRLNQISLGGERVDQAILDRLQQLYPQASITHIYASSEAGACIVVRDCKEGFPALWLSDEHAIDAESPRLQIRDDQLWIRSPYASTQHAGWINSGDLVERRGDRIIILGRANNSIINVGGLKVAPADVERTLLQHPDVAWCRVSPRRTPFMGELVAADVVLNEGAVISDADLTRFCTSHLAEQMIPRFWRFLPAIPVTDNLKTELG